MTIFKNIYNKKENNDKHWHCDYATDDDNHCYGDNNFSNITGYTNN